ncbi:MAG: hypothetical protein H7098_12605 [Oligoflexus sp.]|nr:hypothetical protein [Pseudopedobacter sp.]
MKKTILLIMLILGFECSYSQKGVKDSIFVRIDKLDQNKFSYGISGGKIIALTVLIKNKYENSLGFASGYFNSDLVLKEKTTIDSKKVVEYKTYNEMLNKDFYDIYFHYHTYFIISEDKYNYLVLEVRPILPPELNKM